MAKIAQVITRPSKEYDLFTAEAQVRDLDAIVEKLNTTFQEDLKEEVEQHTINTKQELIKLKVELLQQSLQTLHLEILI